MAGLTKEQRYLKENPTATPYDLLNAEVITQERFDELSQDGLTQSVDSFLQNKPSQTVDQFLNGNKLKPTKIIEHKAQPKLTPYGASNSDVVFLNDKITGKATSMSRGSAEREVRKYPHRYTIN